MYGYCWWVIPPLLAVGILFGFKNILREFRLDRGLVTAFLFAVVAVFPMFTGYWIFGKYDTDLTTLGLLRTTLFAGFFEEFLFRGFLFGILFRKALWGFIPAAMLGALIFGLGHLYQGSNPSQVMGIFFVTFIGAIWFSWLFIEWKENLWVPILLHVLMNLSWTLFDVSDSGALGGNVANIFRIMTIALTVILTIYYNKHKDRFRINAKNLLVNKSGLSTEY